MSLSDLSDSLASAKKYIPKLLITQSSVASSSTDALLGGGSGADPASAFRRLSMPEYIRRSSIGGGLPQLRQLAHSFSMSGGGAGMETGTERRRSLLSLNSGGGGGENDSDERRRQELDGGGDVTPISAIRNPVDLRYHGRLTFLGVPNLGTINPNLYNCADEGDILEYPPSHIGRVWLSLELERDAEKLLVTVIKMRNLPSRDITMSNACDSFVRLYLLPDERKFLQSKIRRRNTNPQYEESFAFEVAPNSVEERVLKLIVFDVDNLRRFVPIGRILYSLNEFIRSRRKRFTTWRDLKKDDSEGWYNRGELCFSLCYNTLVERLSVVILEARNLKGEEDEGNLDSYCRVSLCFTTRTEKTKKTRIVRDSCSPIFSEAFLFKLPLAKLDIANISIDVFQSKPDRQIGRVVVGSQMFTKGKALEHWQDMLANDRETVKNWHFLTG